MRCGIISEYNPFHNGHKYQTDFLKSKYPNAVTVALMSSNFVQRGECALFDKYARAAAAVSAGVDLALSIPFVFSVLSAEGYAEAGVRLAHKLGLDAISFGAECDEYEKLFSIADFMLSEEYKGLVESICASSPSLSLVRAGERAVLSALGKACAVEVSKPNNILALEYIKAIKRYSLPLDVIIVKRAGAGYKSLELSPFPSAMLIREKLYSQESIEGLVPDECYGLYREYISKGAACDRDKFLSHMHFSLLQKSDALLDKCVGSVELASRIRRAIFESDSIDSAASRAVSARFTRARVMRALVSALFEIPHNAFMHKAPAYTQLLAFKESARAYLASRRRESFPIITKNADASVFEQDIEFSAQWRAECMADSFFALSCAVPRPANSFIKQSPFFIKERDK